MRHENFKLQLAGSISRYSTLLFRCQKGDGREGQVLAANSVLQASLTPMIVK